MMETKKLFYEDAYQREFEAEVIEITEEGLVLDQTCFFPEGGGQVGDTGSLNGIRVVDTIKIGAEIKKTGSLQIPVGGKVVHVIEDTSKFGVGDRVRGVIDWDKRYKTMKLHSASHIMQHFLIQEFGDLESIGTKVDEKKDRSDYSTSEKIDPERLKEVENKCNEFISKEHEIKVYQADEEGIWNWECADIKMYCGGTHVKNTKEIGRIRLKRAKSKGAGRERVETYLEE